MDIYIVRHTTPDIEKDICYGQSDLGLIANHLQEFETISNKIPNTTSAKLVSSPLKRCKQLAEYLGHDINFDSRLKELNFGDWELKSWNDIPQDDMNPWMADFVNVKVPNGESYTQLAIRVNNCISDILNSNNNEIIIIVTHAGPIRAFLASILGVELKDSFSIKINYGDVFHLRKENDDVELITDINF